MYMSDMLDLDFDKDFVFINNKNEVKKIIFIKILE